MAWPGPAGKWKLPCNKQQMNTKTNKQQQTPLPPQQKEPICGGNEKNENHSYYCYLFIVIMPQILKVEQYLLMLCCTSSPHLGTDSFTNSSQ